MGSSTLTNWVVVKKVFFLEIPDFDLVCIECWFWLWELVDVIGRVVLEMFELSWSDGETRGISEVLLAGDSLSMVIGPGLEEKEWRTLIFEGSLELLVDEILLVSSVDVSMLEDELIQECDEFESFEKMGRLK